MTGSMMPVCTCTVTALSEPARPGRAIELPRLPRPKSFGDLLRILRRIGGRLERQWREIASELMLSVAVGLVARKPRMNHEWPEQPNDANHVAEDLALVPFRLGLGQRFREAVVECAREELLAAVEPPRLQQFLGANDTKRVEQLRPDDVLPALAACQRQIRDARVVASCRPRHERRVFIIGMGARVEDARGRLQASEEIGQPGRSEVVDRAHLRIRQAVSAR